jgi:hypothetical protein
VGCGVGWSRACPSRGDGSGLRWGLGRAGASGLCAPPAVRGLLSGALKGRCPPAHGNALGTRVPLPHSTLKGGSNRTSHTVGYRTPSGCWIGGCRFSQGVALGWYVLPFQAWKDNSPGSCVNGCVSVHAGTGLTCGMRWGAVANRTGLQDSPRTVAGEYDKAAPCWYSIRHSLGAREFCHEPDMTRAPVCGSGTDAGLARGFSPDHLSGSSTRS